MQTSIGVKLTISETSRGSVREIMNIHQSTQRSTTRVGALMAHHPAWVSHHTGGSRSLPTVHPCSRKGGGCVQRTNNTSDTRRNAPK